MGKRRLDTSIMKYEQLLTQGDKNAGFLLYS